jgi:hypothetical protein
VGAVGDGAAASLPSGVNAKRLPAARKRSIFEPRGCRWTPGIWAVIETDPEEA